MRPLPAVLGTVLVVAACSENPISPGVTSPENQNTNPVLEEVRALSDPYHSVEAALAAGYSDPARSPCYEAPIGAMGIHSLHEGYFADPAVDPAKPEIILYLPQRGGGYVLAGVEWVTEVMVRNPANGSIGPWFAPNPWPPNFEVMNRPPVLFGQTFNGPMAGHEDGRAWHYDLHVWAWEQNPNGDFAQFNPRFTCAGPKS
jgi:hypothetical protein